eukprot:scaffold8569_cov139-Cylindrotheca_fusiformis.AAC.11
MPPTAHGRGRGGRGHGPGRGGVAATGRAVVDGISHTVGGAVRGVKHTVRGVTDAARGRGHHGPGGRHGGRH